MIRDARGKLFTVRYEAVNAMLLNEFLKEHQTVQETESDICKTGSNVARQQKQIEALTTGLQKVSAQLEVEQTRTANGSEQSLEPVDHTRNEPSCFTAWRLFVSRGDTHPL